MALKSQNTKPAGKYIHFPLKWQYSPSLTWKINTQSLLLTIPTQTYTVQLQLPKYFMGDPKY